MIDTKNKNSTKTDRSDRTNRLAGLAQTFNIPNVSDIMSAERWMLYSVIIGVLTGLAAVVFYFAITIVTEHVISGIVGLQIPSPAGEPEILSFLSLIHI